MPLHVDYSMTFSPQVTRHKYSMRIIRTVHLLRQVLI